MTATFAFGGSRYNRLAIEVLGYAQPNDATNYHDANWINVRISVSVGGFTGKFDASFLASELVDFQAQLANLQTSLKGDAKFETLEGQLALDIHGNGLGAMELRGVAQDQAGIGNIFRFCLQLDQTQTSASLHELSEIIVAYPVRDVK